MARSLPRSVVTPPHLDLRAYLGSPLPVVGVRAGDLRARARTALRSGAIARPGPLRDAVRTLWAGRTFEERVLAIELLSHARFALGDRATWNLAARLVDTATGWALSDSLASGPVGRMLVVDPRRFREVRTWTRSPNPWRRRAAAYAMGPWVRAGELDRPFEILERLAADPDRWVQRAVGTWLRGCATRDAHRTERFLRRHVADLAPIAITVATEHSSPRLRTALRNAHARAARIGAHGRGTY